MFKKKKNVSPLKMLFNICFLIVLKKPTNGQVLVVTNNTATLRWDIPTSFLCNLIHQIVNCSSSNFSFEVTVLYKQPYTVILENLKPFTKYTCYSMFFYKEGYSPKSEEIIFWTKLPGNYNYYC